MQLIAFLEYDLRGIVMRRHHRQAPSPSPFSSPALLPSPRLDLMYVDNLLRCIFGIAFPAALRPRHPRLGLAISIIHFRWRRNPGRSHLFFFHSTSHIKVVGPASPANTLISCKICRQPVEAPPARGGQLLSFSFIPLRYFPSLLSFFLPM